MTPAEQRDLIDRYIAAYNAFDVEGMLALMCADVTFANYSSGEPNLTARGKDELRAVGRRTAGLFAQRRQTVTACRHEADRAVVEIDYAAVLACDLPDGARVGDEIAFRGRSEFVFRDGLIAALTDYA